MIMKSIYYNYSLYNNMQDEPIHDFKRILYDCRLPILKQMFPEVSNLGVYAFMYTTLSHDLYAW
jgi:hypothetical protein